VKPRKPAAENGARPHGRRAKESAAAKDLAGTRGAG
jgi:hypothetical protein